MTREDVESLLPIIESIDGGCSVCIHSFCEMFNRVHEFPYYLQPSEDYPTGVSMYDKADYLIVFHEYEDDFELIPRERHEEI